MLPDGVNRRKVFEFSSLDHDRGNIKQEKTQNVMAWVNYPG